MLGDPGGRRPACRWWSRGRGPEPQAPSPSPACDLELDVPAADARVVDPQVGLGAAADDQPGRVQRVPGAVDLEQRAGAAYLGVAGVAGHLGLGAAADPEPAGGQVVGGLEADRDRAGEDVALLLGVVA